MSATKDGRGNGGATAMSAAPSATATRSAPSTPASSAGSARSASMAAPMRLEPATQRFIDSVADAPPLYTMNAKDGHQVLTDLQSKPVPLRPADIEDTEWPVGPTGSTRIRILRPKGAKGRPTPTRTFTRPLSLKYTPRGMSVNPFSITLRSSPSICAR